MMNQFATEKQNGTRLATEASDTVANHNLKLAFSNADSDITK